MEAILSEQLPPFFKAHPKVNPSTGRVLSRPAGGDRAVLDWVEQGENDQSSWRNAAWLSNVIIWVLTSLEVIESINDS